MRYARTVGRNGTLRSIRTRHRFTAVRDVRERKGGKKHEETQALAGKLYPGKQVKVIYNSVGKERDYLQRRRRSGTVEALYPYIFTVDFGNYKESFRYEQLFIQSHEVVRL